MLIAALGSSFAAGPTLEPIADRAAMRSARNYPHLLADALGASLVDLTVTGATTPTILDVPQVIAPRVQFAPQIDGLPPDADLVTITAGGNDLKFIGSMVFTAWRRHDPAGALTKLMRAGVSEARRATHEHYPDGVPAATPGVVAEVAAGLARIVAATRSRAPAARVLLVDYLTVLDAHSRSAVVDFAADELDACRALQSALVEGYAVAARHSGADLVPVSRLSRGHGLGSAEPWVSDFIPEVRRTVGSFHPNAVGMRAIADILGRHLGW